MYKYLLNSYFWLRYVPSLLKTVEFGNDVIIFTHNIRNVEMIKVDVEWTSETISVVVSNSTKIL